MDVFTPNTGQTKNLLTGEERAYNPNQPRDNRGRWTGAGSGGGRIALMTKLYSSGGAKPKADLTKSESNVKLDMNGKPFKYPEVFIEEKAEYRDVIENIADMYKTHYEGKELCALDFVDKTYYFENHGFGDYNIYRIKKGKWKENEI